MMVVDVGTLSKLHHNVSKWPNSSAIRKLKIAGLRDGYSLNTLEKTFVVVAIG